jgi:hypothetical protein
VAIVTTGVPAGGIVSSSRARGRSSSHRPEFQSSRERDKPGIPAGSAR